MTSSAAAAAALGCRNTIISARSLP
jgi:hypothetical protein